VHLLGYKDNPFPYIKLSDVFILTSKFEGSPNVLIEAQFLRKYIISSNCPTGPREILDNGNNGDLFRVGDYKELANLIINYKKNNKKISRGYLSAKKYDLDKNCLKYYNLISKYL
jgi:glycosyltransferase involved in cell wall biosynthesis